MRAARSSCVGIGSQSRVTPCHYFLQLCNLSSTDPQIGSMHTMTTIGLQIALEDWEGNHNSR